MNTITSIPSIIALFYTANLRHTLVFRSQPGIGKTEQVRAAARELGDIYGDFGFIEEHLATRSEVDVRGYLIPDGDDAKYTKPSFWSTIEKHERGILFLDELFQCSAEMQKAIAPLLLDRRIGDYVLPPGWAVVGASNGTQHRSGVVPVLSHVTNRVCLMDVAPPSAQSLAAHYVDANMPAEVIALVLKAPATVLEDHSASTPAGTPYCSPRTLKMAGAALNLFPSVVSALESPTGIAIVEGFIGRPATADLMAVAKLANSIPLMSEIIADPAGSPVPTELDKQWLCASMLGMRTAATELDAVFTYLSRMPPNIAFIGLYACWKRGVTTNSNAINKWVIDNNDLLMAVMSGGRT